MARVSYEPDRDGVRRFAESPALQEAALDAAEAGATFARSIAPVDTGEYAASFEVVPAVVDSPQGPRHGAVLVNTAAHAIYVDGVDGYRVMARTLDAIEGGLT